MNRIETLILTACVLALSSSASATLGAAQSGPPGVPDFAALEKEVSLDPENLEARARLVSAYFDFATRDPLSIDAVRKARRRHITWLIESPPEAPILESPKAIITPRGGPLADPEGYAEAARLWRIQAAKPGAPTDCKRMTPSVRT